MIRLRCEHNHPPTVKRSGDVGFDLYAAENMYLQTGQPAIIKTGVFVDHIQDGYWLQILTKSGSPKKGFFTLAGVVDTEYRGELGVWLVAPAHNLAVKTGDVVGQAVIRQAWYPSEVVTINGEPMHLQDTQPRHADGGMWRPIQKPEESSNG